MVGRTAAGGRRIEPENGRKQEIATLAQEKHTRGELGQGLYGLGELQRYLAFEGKREDGERALYWLSHALNPVGHRTKQPDHSFSDLISLFVVRELRKRGVSLAEISEAERYGRRKFKVDRPFVRNDVATDGIDVCFEADRDERHPQSVESANRGGQRVLVEPIRDRLRTVRYTEGEWGSAFAWAPLPGVVLDPAVQFGAPVIDGTRVPAQDAAELADQLGVDETAERLSVGVPEIKNAITFQNRLANLG